LVISDSSVRQEVESRGLKEKGLPAIGQNLAQLAQVAHYQCMQSADLVSQVAASTGLTTSVAARVVTDVIAYYDEPVEDFVRRRHAHLKTHGMRNPEIFAQISTELASRVVSAPPLSDRQLRRVVYG